MRDDVTKRLMWGGLVAGLGALSSLAASKLASAIWRQVFNEDPPE